MHIAEPIIYREHLEKELHLSAGKRKGERTRDRLMHAAACILESKGYRELRIADICELAEVSTATFYGYFEHRTEITLEVLTGFLRVLFTHDSDEPEVASPFEAIYLANVRWVASVKNNAGLLRCVLQLGDEIPEFAEFYQRCNRDWYELVTKTIVKKFYSGKKDEKVILLAVYSLGAMMDELSRQLATNPNPYLNEIIEKAGMDEEAVAEFLSVIWYRVLYGSAPSQALKSRSAKLLGKLSL